MNAVDIRKVEVLDIELIEVHARQRAVTDDAVATLAASIEKLGLRTPISVRYYSERPDTIPAGETDDALVLMTGAHRLAAAKKLGWEKIECFVYYQGDEVDAQLWEIAENLHRADLTKEQRDGHIRRYAELLSQRQSTQIASIESKREDGKGHRHQGIASQIAAETGVSKDTVRRALNPERVQAERARSQVDADVKARAAKEVAEIIAEHVPGEWWDAVKANLYAAGAANIAHALTNITGEAVMDKSRDRA
jgi:ParB/RepB/Spo0J family partition protein